HPIRFLNLTEKLFQGKPFLVFSSVEKWAARVTDFDLNLCFISDQIIKFRVIRLLNRSQLSSSDVNVRFHVAPLHSRSESCHCDSELYADTVLGSVPPNDRSRLRSLTKSPPSFSHRPYSLTRTIVPRICRSRLLLCPALAGNLADLDSSKDRCCA